MTKGKKREGRGQERGRRKGADKGGGKREWRKERRKRERERITTIGITKKKKGGVQDNYYGHDKMEN